MSFVINIVPPPPFGQLKTAHFKLLRKKRRLGKLILYNHKPTSNLSLISTIIEKLVFQQVNTFLTRTCHFTLFHSCFSAHHSEETALVKMLHDDNHLNIDFQWNTNKTKVIIFGQRKNVLKLAHNINYYNLKPSGWV